MIECQEPGALVEGRIDRILTQYRESPHLLGLIRNILGQIEAAALAICEVPSFFDIETAVGDQLTLIGKRLGFPRCQCVCVLMPVWGFTCGGSYEGPYRIIGFGDDGSWADCGDTGTGDLCIDDDEMYRRMLMARRFQMLKMYDYDSLLSAARYIWGETATVANLGSGKVVVVPGRALTQDEYTLRGIAFRALPIAPGVKALTADTTGLIAGFGNGWGGFCADYQIDVPLVTEVNTQIVTENDDYLLVGSIQRDAEWLCPVDPNIYTCPQ